MRKYILDKKENSYLKKLIINQRIDYIRKNKIYEREILIDFREFIENEKNLKGINEKLIYEEKKDINFENFIESFNDQRVIEAYEQLDIKEQLLIYEYYHLGYLDREIGRKFNKSENALRLIRNRIIKKIRKIMEEGK